MTQIELSNVFFPRDTYDTPSGIPSCWLDKVLLRSRWWYHQRVIKSILTSRSYADKGVYTDSVWTYISYSLFLDLERSGGRFHIQGINNLKTGHPMIIVSNHMSTLETFIFPCIMVPFYPITFIVKDNLVKSKYFGAIMRSRNPIVVGRQSSRQDLAKVLKEGEERISRGYSIVVYPQSSRFVDFDPSRFNTLGIKLAQRTGVKIMPVALKTDFWGVGRWLKDFGPINRKTDIYMNFGKPLDIIGNGKDQHQKIIEFIQSNLKKWHEIEKQKNIRKK